MPQKKSSKRSLQLTKDSVPATSLLATWLDVLAGKPPESIEPTSEFPDERTRVLAKAAALKAACISGSFSLPPGPLGFITAIPELLAVWKVQAQLVADIASAYGLQIPVNREQLVYCLFKNMACQVARDMAVRAAERLIVRKACMSTVGRICFRIGVPIIGAAGAAAYAWYDTMQVAKRAAKTFEDAGAKSRRKPAATKRSKVVPFPTKSGSGHRSSQKKAARSLKRAA